MVQVLAHPPVDSLSAGASAVSVLPTPDGPASINTPTGCVDRPVRSGGLNTFTNLRQRAVLAVTRCASRSRAVPARRPHLSPCAPGRNTTVQSATIATGTNRRADFRNTTGASPTTPLAPFRPYLQRGLSSASQTLRHAVLQLVWPPVQLRCPARIRMQSVHC